MFSFEHPVFGSTFSVIVRPREGIKGKIKDIVLPLVNSWVYHKNPGKLLFRH